MGRMRHLVLATLGGLLLSGLFGCTAGEPAGQESSPVIRPKSIEQVLREHTPAWMAIPGVTGTALGEAEGQPVIKIYVTRISPQLKAQLPAVQDGYPVVLEPTGPFRTLQDRPPSDTSSPHDPAD